MSSRRQVLRRHAAPFDLENGPILRMTLLSRAQEDHVLLLVVHHIACDGMSMGILLGEFIHFYAAECRGHALDHAPALVRVYRLSPHPPRGGRRCAVRDETWNTG